MIKEYLQIYKLNIVVLGRFNPAIIQPFWLANKKLIREQEAQSADIQIIHNDIVSYKIGWAEINVTKDRIQIGTAQEGLFDSLKDLILGILSFLKETPVMAFGINHLRYYTIPDENRYYQIGNRLAPLSLWKGELVDPRMNRLEIIQAKRIDNKAGSYRVTISRPDIPMPNYSILVNINDHFELINNETITEVIDVIEKGFNNSISTSEEIINTLWNNLNL